MSEVVSAAFIIAIGNAMAIPAAGLLLVKLGFLPGVDLRRLRWKRPA